MIWRARYWHRVVAIAVAAVALIGAAMIPLAQADPTVFPRDAVPYGNTYGEWSARWWQWLLAIPTPLNPNLDTTGQHCQEGQAGPVWFLAGAFSPGIGLRSCTVPAGKAILLPLTNTLFGSGAFDCKPTVPKTSCDINAIRRAAANDIDSRTFPTVQIDGTSVDNVIDFRVQSPVITLTYPKDNVIALLFGRPSVHEGTYTPNVSDGYFLIIAPLSHGAHTIALDGVVIWNLSIE